MARSSSTFNPDTAPKGNKGAKHKRTKLKEAFGIKTWKDLQNFVENDGLQKLTEEMGKLKGSNYAYVYLTLCEYIKPKLSRQTVVGDKDKPIQHNMTVTVVHSPVPLAENESDVS